MIEMTAAQVFAKAVGVVAELGIADLLASGSRTSVELAAATRVHAPSLYRVLRSLASIGVFDEEEGRTFRLTPLGATLRSDVPESVRDWVLVNCGIAWRPCGELLYSVQTGQPGFDRTYGMPIFEYLAKHPDDAATFARMFVEFHGPEAPAVASAYGLSDVKSLVDIGGGLGNLIAAFLAANPGLTGTLFELPHVAERAIQRLHAAGLSQRCDVLDGDFFESIPAGADVYVLSHVIHDWDDARCLTLLGNCRRAIPPTGRLLIVEIILPPANQPSQGNLMDLIMLINSPHGQERTLEEYRKLLTKTGFRLARVVPTTSPVSVIEALPDSG
jgi:hypothetical protein